MKNEKNYAGQRFSINLNMKIVVDVSDDTNISDILKTIYLMLNDEKEIDNKEIFEWSSDRKKFNASIIDAGTKIENWQITDITDLYWSSPKKEPK